MDKNLLEDYIIQVQGKRLKGSGVLFLYYNKVCIFTAKHNFEFVEKQKIKNITVEKVEAYKEKIEIYPHRELKIKKVIGLDEVLIDFLILEIDENSIGNMDIKELNIGALNSVCTIAGNPTIRDRASNLIEYFDCKYEINESHKFEVFSEKINALNEKEKEELVVGISGGGAFIEKDNKINLAGIVIAYEGFSNLVCIDLRYLKEEIECKLFCSDIDYIEDEIIVNSDVSFFIKMVNLKSKEYNLNVAIYPVTYSQYDLFCKEKRNGRLINNYCNLDREKFPTVKITWEDTIEFSTWLTKNSKNKRIYTLPTSRQWEFIANQNKLDKNICYKGGTNIEIGTNLGQKGIYDFLGNIQEICLDKVIRGGFFKNDLNKIIENREGITLLPRNEVGFRVIQANL